MQSGLPDHRDSDMDPLILPELKAETPKLSKAPFLQGPMRKAGTFPPKKLQLFQIKTHCIKSMILRPLPLPLLILPDPRPPRIAWLSSVVAAAAAREPVGVLVGNKERGGECVLVWKRCYFDVNFRIVRKQTALFI